MHILPGDLAPDPEEDPQSGRSQLEFKFIFGSAPNRPFVYGCAGCLKNIILLPDSMIFPAYTTATIVTCLIYNTEIMCNQNHGGIPIASQIVDQLKNLA